jgi:hypothetical protein
MGMSYVCPHLRITKRISVKFYVGGSALKAGERTLYAFGFVSFNPSK